MPQKGLISLLLVVIALVLTVSTASFLLLKYNAKQSENSVATLPNNSGNKVVESPDEPPLKLKSIGVNLDYYNPKTGKAGDFEFTKQKLEFNRLFMGFGFVIPAEVSSTQNAKTNPQATFVVPLGTKVRSLVDGVVVAIPTLWSNDYSIQVTQDGKMQKWIYEVEHLINPQVNVGEHVSAGQVIGEVSNFNRGAPSGFGTFEIGILKGGQIPEHVCPFAYLDESIKAETLKQITSLFKSWEDYIKDETLYNETTIPGCLTMYAVKG